MQLHHHNTDLKFSKFDVLLLCDGVNSPANIGSLLRVADSFGVQKVIFGNVSVDLTSPRLKRTARSTQNHISIEGNIPTIEALQKLKTLGYTLIALEITDKSIAIDQFNFLNLKGIVLVIGDENLGVSEEVLKECEAQVHITMYGKNSSMNVSQATSVALYEITKQLQ